MFRGRASGVSGRCVTARARTTFVLPPHWASLMAGQHATPAALEGPVTPPCRRLLPTGHIPPDVTCHRGSEAEGGG